MPIAPIAPLARPMVGARRLSLGVAAAILVAGATMLTPLHASAANFVVATGADGADTTPGDGICDAPPAGLCTLRAAIQTANQVGGNNTITLPARVYTLTIAPVGVNDITTGDLNVTDTTGTITVTGAGAGSTIVDGNGTDRIFHVAAGANLTLTGTTVRNGHSLTGAGGGILSDGTLTLTNDVISGNTASREGGGVNVSSTGVTTVSSTVITANTSTNRYGGGLSVAGTGTVTDTTISNNTVAPGFYGGGLDVDGTVTLLRVTINGNTVPGTGGDGGGIDVDGTLTATNVTITGNSVLGNGIGGGLGLYNVATLTNVTIDANSVGVGGSGANISAVNATTTTIKNSIVSNPIGATNCDVVLTSAGSNLESGNSCGFTGTGDLINTIPQLGPLQSNGGLTATQLPAAGSPAINAVRNACPPPSFDQRLVTRPQGPACDIGAVEALVAVGPTACPASGCTGPVTPAPTAGTAPITAPNTGAGGGAAPGNFALVLLVLGAAIAAATTLGVRGRRHL